MGTTSCRYMLCIFQGSALLDTDIYDTMPRAVIIVSMVTSYRIVSYRTHVSHRNTHHPFFVSIFCLSHAYEHTCICTRVRKKRCHTPCGTQQHKALAPFPVSLIIIWVNAHSTQITCEHTLHTKNISFRALLRTKYIIQQLARNTCIA